jgi:hypothetical protein
MCGQDVGRTCHQETMGNLIQDLHNFTGENMIIEGKIDNPSNDEKHFVTHGISMNIQEMTEKRKKFIK